MQENNTLDGDALGNDNEGKYHARVYSNTKFSLFMVTKGNV